MENKTYTVTIYSENQIGLLMQISNIFTRHSLSIWSLSASASSIEGIHTITIITDSPSEKQILEVVMQLEKRVDVVKAFYYTNDQIIYRELALYKMQTAKLLECGRIEDLLTNYNARIVEMNNVFTVIQKTGKTEETQSLYDELNKYGVMQFVRSGRIAVTREKLEPVKDFIAERELEKNKINKEL
ncbi:MAG: acetolactate synthase small subunit [Bacteroidales bacterium]|jgi:acetolactate synthase-1/3 small subunit|nr:acetolactate synthase small subunit [Bacteroidales bacterium]MCI1784888.1 acetolactate synthase small subunit [Bacteroidales bacterium]